MSRSVKAAADINLPEWMVAPHIDDQTTMEIQNSTSSTAVTGTASYAGVETTEEVSGDPWGDDEDEGDQLVAEQPTTSCAEPSVVSDTNGGDPWADEADEADEEEQKHPASHVAPPAVAPQPAAAASSDPWGDDGDDDEEKEEYMGITQSMKAMPPPPPPPVPTMQVAAPPTKPQKPAKSQKPVPAAAPAAANGNPFGDDEDEDEDADAPAVAPVMVRTVYRISDGPKAPAKASANPFGDDSDDDLPDAAVVGGAVSVMGVVGKPKAALPGTMFNEPATAVPVSREGARCEKAASPSATRAAAGAGAGAGAGARAPLKPPFAFKVALKELMLMGFAQAQATLQLEAAGGNKDAAILKIVEGLKLRPGNQDIMLWRPVLMARVTAWMPTGSGNEQHTLYTANVTMDVPAHSTWKIALRYSRFKEMYDAIYKPLGKAVPEGLDVPFPVKGWLSSDTDKKRTERQHNLDAWLRALLGSSLAMASPGINAAVWAILDVQTNLKSSAAPRGSVTAAGMGVGLRRPPGIR